MDLERMEENEVEWFSLWTNRKELDSAVLLYNARLEPDPIFNHLDHIRATSDTIDVVLDQSFLFLRRRGITPSIYVSPLSTPRDLGERLERKGLTRYDSMNIMKYTRSNRSPTGVQYKIIDFPGLEVWVKVLMPSFSIENSWRSELMRRGKQVLRNPKVSLFLAYHNSSPAGTLALFSDKGVSGIYFLGTLPEFRQLGVGSTLIMGAVSASKDLGSDILCLQNLAGDKVEDFYIKNQFRTVARRAIYQLPH